MRIDFNTSPFAEIPVRLREWFTEVIQRAKAEDDSPFWREAFPPGSTTEDMVAVSKCIRKLFPNRVKREYANISRVLSLTGAGTHRLKSTFPSTQAST